MDQWRESIPVNQVVSLGFGQRSTGEGAQPRRAASNGDGCDLIEYTQARIARRLPPLKRKHAGACGGIAFEDGCAGVDDEAAEEAGDANAEELRGEGEDAG